jgi:hypothetical protein
MIRLFIRIKEIFFAVRIRVLWIIPVSVSLFWNPCFPLPVKAAKVAELSGNQGQKQTTLKNSQINLPDLSVKDPLEKLPIIHNGPGGTLLKFQVKADFLETFKPEIDIFQNTSSEFDETFLSSSSASNESDNRFEIFRLEQKLDGFNYGLEYRYVGKNLNYFNRYKQKTETKTKVGLENDQEGVEIWGEKNIRSIGIKTFFSRFLDNVDRDPTLPRMLTHKYGLEMNYRMVLLPICFSFSHSREESKDTFESGNSEYQGKQKETYNSSLKYYGGKAYDITASSSYSFSHDLFNSNQETESFRHGISSSVRPASNLTITPTLSLGEYRYLWYGEHEKNPSASLSITYSQLFNVVDLSLRGRYSQTKNANRSLDTERLNTSIGLRWNADNLFFRKIGYSLNLGYNQYLDKINRNSSYNSLSTSFKLEFQL